MITRAQRVERMKCIGSSDLPAILGLSPYATAHDLFLDKTGQLAPFAGNKYTEAGNVFEPSVLNWAEFTLGTIERNVRREAEGLSFPLASNLDGVVLADKCPSEAKTAGLFGPLSAGWGEDGTDQVPESYIAQCQVHMLVTKTERCHLPAFLGGRGFALFEIPRNEEFLKIILERCEEFWASVRTGIAPAWSMPTVDVMKRRRRSAGKTIGVPPTLIVGALRAREEVKAAKEAQEIADAALLAALGDAEEGTSAAGRITYNLIDRKGYSVAATSFRQMRVTKAK